MLGCDEKSKESESGYMDILSFIQYNGADIEYNAEELWRRILFNVCVHNTDDHLRNHGFLLTPKGWILSPAYDINPTAYGKSLSINISEHDNSVSVDLVMSVADHFIKQKPRQKQVYDQVINAVSQWKNIAIKHGINRDEINKMKTAFDIPE